MRRALSLMLPAARDEAAHGGGGGGGAPYERLEARAASKPGFRRKTWLLRGIGLCVVLGLFLATSLTLGRKDNLHKVLTWVHEHKAAGLAIFGLLYCWFTVMFLPPALLAACAGALYGFWLAIPIVWVCAVVGETVSFLLGRFLLRKWVTELTADWPMWLALNAALREDGWKLVALLRVSPVMPFSIINYALGTSALPFSHYFLPSVIGIMPSLIIYVWLGSLAADVTEAVAGGGMSAPPAAKITVIVLCAVSALVVVVLSAVYTKRAIDRRLASVNVQEEVRVEEQHFLADEEEEAGEPAAAAASLNGPGAPHTGRVLVCIESPVRFVGGGGGGAAHAGDSSASPLAPATSWLGRVAQRLGGGGGGSGKAKASEETGVDVLSQQQWEQPNGGTSSNLYHHQQHQAGSIAVAGSSSSSGGGVSSSNSSSRPPSLHTHRAGRPALE